MCILVNIKKRLTQWGSCHQERIHRKERPVGKAGNGSLWVLRWGLFPADQTYLLEFLSFLLCLEDYVRNLFFKELFGFFN